MVGGGSEVSPFFAENSLLRGGKSPVSCRGGVSVKSNMVYKL
jgi:hypothetical protein